MAAGNLILLGVIAGAHGIRGEVKLKSFTAQGDDIAAYGVLLDETGTRQFRLKSLKPARGAFIARIEGVGDRDAAEALKGTRLFVPRDRLPPPADDEFYHADLIGLAVVDTEGRTRGTVRAVENYGAGDLLEIGDDAASDLLPFTAAFVPDIDLARARIVIAPPDGFLQPATDGGEAAP